MDGKGLRALLCVLVVIGCSLGFVTGGASPVLADSDANPTQTHGQEQLQLLQDDQQTDGEDEDEDEDVQRTGSERLNDASEIHISVAVQDDGSASFVVDYRFENDSDSNWQELREDIEENTEAYAEAERGAWDATIEDGENATDREMELSNLSIETDTSSQPRDLGHVRVSFEWSSFAYVELNRIEVGDSLTGLTMLQDTTMQVFPPDGYVINDDETEDDEDGEESVFWHGDSVDFASEPPTVVMIQNGNGDETPPEEETRAEEPSMPWLVVAAALALLATVGAAGWWVRDRGILGPDGGQPEATPPGPAPAEEQRTESTSSEPPPELLSNEERVLRLLETHGGRIKQQEVVAELDWTEAKTSQVVSGLREDGEIEVFRIGRENVLALPDDDSGQNGVAGGNSGPAPDTGTEPPTDE